DGQAALRAHRLSGARGLYQEHDYGGRSDGWGDPGRGRERRADAPNARACAAGAAGERSVPGGVHEQGGHGGRPGDFGLGGAGGTGAVEEVPVSGGRRAGGAGLGAAGEREPDGSEGGGGDLEADGGGRQLYPDAAAAGGQAVLDADRGHILDHGAGDGGDGAGGAGGRGGGGGGRGGGGARHAQDG